MNKQQEIREEIETLLYDAASGDDVLDRMLKYLHSQGVVIKVETGEDLTGCSVARLEPLIEEE